MNFNFDGCEKIKIKVPAKRQFVDEDYVLLFGKYRGQSISHVLKIDEKYCTWLCGEPGAQDDVKLWHVIKDCAFKAPFGKYVGYTYEWIHENDPNYYKWLSDNLDKKNLNTSKPAFHKFHIKERDEPYVSKYHVDEEVDDV